MMLFVMYFSQTCCFFIPLRPKYEFINCEFNFRLQRVKFNFFLSMNWHMWLVTE
jgi:hypothetical protein